MTLVNQIVKNQIVKDLQHNTRYINCTFYLEKIISELGGCYFENCSFRGEEVVIAWLVKSQFKNCNFNKLTLKEISHVDIEGGYISHLELRHIRECARGIDKNLEFIKGTVIHQLTLLLLYDIPSRLFDLQCLEMLRIEKIHDFIAHSGPVGDFFDEDKDILPEEYYYFWGIEPPGSRSCGLHYTELQTSIPRFPEEISKLKNLRILDLSDCLIYLIPHQLYKLKNLESLDLSSNRIGYKNFSLKKGENLYMDCVGSIPFQFAKMQNIKELNLSQNSISTFPYHICYLKTLEKLDLSSNRITEVTPLISNLENLKYLNLQNNKLDDEQKNNVMSLLPNCGMDL